MQDLETTPEQKRQNAEAIANLTTRQVHPKPKHIKQARSFHKVLCHKGYDAKDNAAIMSALMDMLLGKR